MTGPYKSRSFNNRSWIWSYEIDGRKVLHRENGPAILDDNGDLYWMINDKMHRLDGPAAEFADGGKEWFVNGKQIQCKSQEEFDRLMKLKLFW